MGNGKKFLYTIAAGMALGAIFGVLYAPDKGAKTRAKLNRLKNKFTGTSDEEIEEADHETLEELSVTLKDQLEKINRRLEK